MFGSLKSFFDDNIAARGEQDDVDRLQVATCALLLEAAHADDNFSRDEMDTIIALIGRRFGLAPEAAAELLQVAEAERKSSGDLYQFARLVNESFSHQRKLAVVELLWQVVYSDGLLEAHEDALMHKIGTLLGVRHEELIALKIRVKREQGL